MRQAMEIGFVVKEPRPGYWEQAEVPSVGTLTMD